MNVRVDSEIDGGIAYGNVPVISIENGLDIVFIPLEDVDELLGSIIAARRELESKLPV